MTDNIITLCWSAMGILVPALCVMVIELMRRKLGLEKMRKVQRELETKKELAEAAGYSYRHLHNIDLNLPEGAKLFVEGEGKKFDLSVFIQHWVDYCIGNVSEAERGLDEVRASHEA